MAVKLTKNKRLDVAYVKFKAGRVAETVEVRPGVLLDLDSKGNILGIEVLSLKTLAPVLKAVPRRSTANRKAAA